MVFSLKKFQHNIYWLQLLFQSNMLQKEKFQLWRNSLSIMSIKDLEDLLKSIEKDESFPFPIDKCRKTIRGLIASKISEVEPATRIVEFVSEGSGLPWSPEIQKTESGPGDINLLMNDVPITLSPFDKIMIELAKGLIETTGGLMPTLEVKQATNSHNEVYLRHIARWVIPGAISLEELYSLAHIVRGSYEQGVSGHKSKGSGWERTSRYFDLENNVVPARECIYFGPSARYIDAHARGVLVSRRFRNAAEARYLKQTHRDDWIARSVEGLVLQTEIELREGPTEDEKKMPSLSQDKYLQLVVQISYLLGKKKLINNRILMAAICRELNRVGTSNIQRDALYGMHSVLETIERVLVMPLQRPDIAKVLEFPPESILLVGVPGVGKSFLSHYLMTGDYNAIFAAVDSERVRSDLRMSNDIGVTMLFLKIDKIRSETGLPIVLLLDDIDIILDKDDVVAKFLGLMQGIRQKGFFIIASTNHPEKIDYRLLEPGRFSKVVHVGLPKESDRVGVIATHLRNKRFSNEDKRQEVISNLAKKTEGWTQRYLWELCTEACRQCALEAITSGQADSLGNLKLTGAHLDSAFAELSRSFDVRKVREADHNIRKFISRFSSRVGF